MNTVKKYKTNHKIFKTSEGSIGFPTFITREAAIFFLNS